MGKKIKTALIIAAALIAAAAAVFVALKLMKKDKVNEANLTLFKCHMGQKITDSELADIKDIIEAAVPGRVLDVAKGSIPYIESLTDEEGEEIELGDSVTVTLSLLTDEQKTAVFSAVAKKYGITGGHLVEIKDIYRND